MDFDPQTLRVQFLRYGVRSAEELAQAAGVSQPTISRALRKLPGSLVRMGRGRVARYALANPIEELGSNWPLYVIGPDGVAEQLGRLHSLLGGKYWLERATNRWPTLFDDAFPNNVFPDLPWFLDDYRPQGFLGRAFARKHAAALGQELNPAGWSGRVVMEAMVRFGGDFPGAFALGREALAAAIAALPSAVIHGRRAEQYPRLAELALSGELVGSSAGGEQPKFVVAIAETDAVRHLIVKFSPLMSERIGRRWADLLYAEHVAGAVLAAHGHTVARSEIIDAGGYRFLEVERFDRTAGGGRLPVLSLRSMTAAILDGVGEPWPVNAAALRENRWLSASDAEQLASSWEFGKLIANTDMHEGNASLIFTPERPVRLAPIYDMLPMAYRPDNVGQVPGVLRSQLAAGSNHSSSKVQGLAREFWGVLANSAMVSGEFRSIAEEHAKALQPPGP